jgi:hypothetical protein
VQLNFFQNFIVQWTFFCHFLFADLHLFVKFCRHICRSFNNPSRIFLWSLSFNSIFIYFFPLFYFLQIFVFVTYLLLAQKASTDLLFLKKF